MINILPCIIYYIIVCDIFGGDVEGKGEIEEGGGEVACSVNDGA